jgi:preprotein translocase subunit SecD
MSRSFIFVFLLSALSFWLILPAGKINIPGKKTSVVFKKKNISLNLLNKDIKINQEFKLGLDLQGGSHLVFELGMDRVKKAQREDAADASKNIIEKRVNFYGVGEPQIFLLKDGSTYKVSVDIPGNKSADEAVALIGKTAELSFREQKIREIKQGTESAHVAYFEKTILNGSHLKRAGFSFDQKSGKPVVELVFNKEGTRIFADLTKKNLNKPLAIYLDEQLLTSPVVQSVIKNGTAIISGEFTVEEAKNYKDSINAGALPTSIKLIGQETVEATLGAENVRMSMVAGLVGLLCVAAFMALVYKKEGLVAIFSLGLYALFSGAIYKTFGIVLTLSGIAGLVLSIGMAVDSNILIYERIKEEILKKQTKERAVRIGFFKALSAIKSANINTLLVCLILFNPLNYDFLPMFGSVRGFAVTLSIGVLLSLFTGVFITKNLLWKLYRIEK